VKITLRDVDEKGVATAGSIQSLAGMGNALTVETPSW
jgi:hypothetical protein